MSNQCDKLASLTEISSDSNISPALNQGIKFKDYQTKFSNHLEKKSFSNKEGFANFGFGVNRNNISEANVLARQTDKIVQENNFSNQQTEIDSLREQYHERLIKFQDLTARINGSSNSYLDRVNNNPYLGKNIRFTTGHVCYVTQQGVVKYIPNMDVWNSIIDNNSCPGQTYTEVNMPWLPEYDTPGTPIKELNLITGTPMKQGQSCGFAGKNVFVDSLMKNPIAKYLGCYTDNLDSPLMTFIGDSPPKKISIYNGNFSQPNIGKNKYRYLSWNTTLIPGWNFNCVIINNSKAWGFPRPYPYGPQCAVIQNGQQLWTLDSLIFYSGVEYTLSFSACGRNCCDGSGLSNLLKIGLEGNTLHEITPPINKWTRYDLKITGTDGGKRITFIGTATTDRSTALQGIELTTNGILPSNGTYTYDMCKQEAVNSGNQYFALQGVNTETSTGYCSVSNSEPTATSLGESLVLSGQTAIWSSNSGGGTGNIALLNNSGALVVNNSSGAAVWSSPDESGLPGNYLGCYGDCSLGRGLPEFRGSGSTYETCQSVANNNKKKYFGLQYTQPNGQSECWTGDDIISGRSMGKAGNCTLLNGIQVGGGCSNAIYNTNNDADSVIASFLILQDDGNLCLYRGTSPTDNQGYIWCSKTNGYQQQPNPKYAAVKSKFGKNWIPNGTTLAAGDFIGSNNGSIYLIMQSDGNLVLYTSTMQSNCSTMKDGNTGSGMGGNALYDLEKRPFNENIGKVGYVDEENVLHEYDSNNTKLTDIYAKFNKVDTYGNDIQSASYGGSSIEQCKSSCNNSKDCYGFVFDNTNKVCYPKTSSAWPYGGPLRSLSYTDTYVRGKAPISVPDGVSKDVEGVDSIQYQMYVTGGKLDGKYGLANATTAEQQELDQLQSEMQSLSRQIATSTDKFGEGTNNAQSQSYINSKSLQKYLKKEESINQQIDAMNPNKRSEVNPDKRSEGFRLNNNLDKILQDSDIVVLQKNYDYLFWSILAAGSVLVAMNIKTSP